MRLTELEEQSMAAGKKPGIPENILEAYERVVAEVPGVERKGATHPYTSLNGHMFSCLHPPGTLALRLPEEEREKFLAKFKTRLFESYGVVQKEYVTVPDKLLEDTKTLKKYFEISLRYVQTLKPKKSKKAS
jgi:hypothetical protein